MGNFLEGLCVSKPSKTWYLACPCQWQSVVVAIAGIMCKRGSDELVTRQITW